MAQVNISYLRNKLEAQKKKQILNLNKALVLSPNVKLELSENLTIAPLQLYQRRSTYGVEIF